jgi:hypothetical protein
MIEGRERKERGEGREKKTSTPRKTHNTDVAC